MSEIFKKHIDKFAQISDEEFEEILKFFEIKQVSKKENLLEEGQTCRYHYFVMEGLLRKFYINEKVLNRRLNSPSKPGGLPIILPMNENRLQNFTFKL